jgi:methylase of polypeptide subunit release factors
MFSRGMEKDGQNLDKESTRRIIESRRALLEKSQQENFPYTVEVCGMSLLIYRGVFSPKWFESSGLFCDMLPSMSGLKFLDMGCGCGVITIKAALSGASVADGVDIAREAVVNTHRNAKRLGVSHLVRCWQSDLFSEISPNSQYDVIFWNPPWLFLNSTYRYKSLLEMSLFDPGYTLLTRFFKEALLRLSPDGRMLLGFADFGEVHKLEDMASRFRYTLKELKRRPGKLSQNSFTYFIFELRPKANSDCEQRPSTG